jgi:hypothetical protein
MNRKGQVWTTDFLIGLGLFIIIIFVVLKVLMGMNITDEKPKTYDDAVHLSSQLLTQGYPKNWTNNTVIMPGIAKDNRINITKLDEYSKIPYEQTKLLYHISSEYIFFFTNGTHVLNITKCIQGYPVAVDAECNPLLDSVSYSDLSKIDRIVLLNETTMRMTIYAWK